MTTDRQYLWLNLGTGCCLEGWMLCVTSKLPVIWQQADNTFGWTLGLAVVWRDECCVWLVNQPVIWQQADNTFGWTLGLAVVWRDECCVWLVKPPVIWQQADNTFGWTLGLAVVWRDECCVWLVNCQWYDNRQTIHLVEPWDWLLSGGMNVVCD